MSAVGYLNKNLGHENGGDVCCKAFRRIRARLCVKDKQVPIPESRYGRGRASQVRSTLLHLRATRHVTTSTPRRSVHPNQEYGDVVISARGVGGVDERAALFVQRVIRIEDSGNPGAIAG